MKRLVGLLLVCAGLPVPAQPMGQAIFGFQLGGVIQRPYAECPAHGTRNDYCYFLSPVGPSSRGYVTLKRPTESGNGIPRWVRDLVSLTVAPDGVIVEITVETAAGPAQLRVMESLTERFGQPTARAVREAQNAYGAKWEVLSASWDLPNIKIAYDCASRDECILKFTSPTHAEEVRQQENAARSKDKM